MAQGMMRLSEEDPTLQFSTNNETHEMILSGLGEQHLDVAVSKLKSKFGVDVTLKKPKVPYRETIRKTVQVQGRHKKQTGGHGQFGDVWIEFSPCDSEGLEFGERVVGGSVPKASSPRWKRACGDCIQRGPLAGYPVVGLSAVLYDGSYHPVDSSEMAFKTAAALAYKAGMPQANPVLLEPIGHLKATVPDANMGDVMGEVNKRRGRVLGMEPAGEGKQTVEADVPQWRRCTTSPPSSASAPRAGAASPLALSGMRKRPPTWPRRSLRRPRQRPGNNHAKRVKVFWSNFFQKVCEVWSRAPRP